MLRIAGGVALQARRGRAREQASRHVVFLRDERPAPAPECMAWAVATAPGRSAPACAARYRRMRTSACALASTAARHSDSCRWCSATGFERNFRSHSGSTRAPFRQQLRRQLLLRILIALHAHQDRALLRRELMAAHAVVLLDHPPAFLNVTPGVAGIVLITRGQGTLLASQQEGSEVLNLQLGKM